MEYRYRPSSRTFMQERMNLSQALATIRKKIQTLLESKGTPVSGYNDIAVYRAVARGEQIWYEEWDRHGDSPYYGRLEYVDRGEQDEPSVVYVSKAQRSLSFEDSKGRMTDIIPWNAPVARMYITHRSVPGVWELERVTRVLIEEAELQEVADTFRGPSLPALPTGEGENVTEQLFEKRGGGKLADIVATLQEEQYDLIVQPLRENLVIEGGPGSGKTEIALHRIVHLLHAAALSPQNILYLGPSGPFLRYVSEILPTLDAGEVVLHDMTSWLSRELGLPVRKKSAGPDDTLLYDELYPVRLAQWVQTYIHQSVDRLGDLRMTLDVETVSGRHQRTCELLASQVREILTAHSLRSLAEGWRLLEDRWAQAIDTVLSGADSRDSSQYRKQGRQRFERWREGADIIADLRGLIAAYPEARAESGLASAFLPDAVWSLADALALMYLSGKFFGHPRHYALVVLDEAQDLPAVGFALARQLLAPSAGSLTVVGDPYQHLNPYTEVGDWTALADQLGAQHIALKDNYRSGENIVRLANAAHPAGIRQIARRPGGIAHAARQASRRNLAEEVLREVHRGTDQYLGQVAVIFGNKIPRDILDQLFAGKQDGVEMAVEPDNPEPYEVIVATVEYAKGLEFDLAILVAESPDAFEDTSAGHYKLYTAISRAREEVMIIGLGHTPKLYERCYRQATHPGKKRQ